MGQGAIQGQPVAEIQRPAAKINCLSRCQRTGPRGALPGIQGQPTPAADGDVLVEGDAAPGIEGEGVGAGPGEWGVNGDVLSSVVCAQSTVGSGQGEVGAGQLVCDPGVVEGTCGGVAGDSGYGDGARVEQHRAGLAVGRRQVGVAGDLQALQPRDFSKTTVARFCTAPGLDVAVELGGALRPDGDLASITGLSGIRLDQGVRLYGGGLAGGDGDLAAVCGRGGFTLSRGPSPLGGGEWGGGAGVGDAALGEGDGFLRLDQDPSALGDDGFGAEGAGLGDGMGVETNAAALGDDLAEVDRLPVRGGVLHPHRRVQPVGDLHRVAGGEDDVAVGAVDQAGVLDVRRDQVDEAAGRGGDRAVVPEPAFQAGAGEVEPPGQEVGVAQVQGGGDQAGRVDPAALAEDDAVRVDQEDPAVRLQLSENPARVLADHAVEHRARGALLDEPGDFVAADVELAPVDDGVGAVGHRQGVAAGLEAGAAVRDAGGGRVRERGGAGAGQGDRQGSEGEPRATAMGGGGERPGFPSGGLALGGGDLLAGDEDAQDFAEDEAEATLVHDRWSLSVSACA